MADNRTYKAATMPSLAWIYVWTSRSPVVSSRISSTPEAKGSSMPKRLQCQISHQSSTRHEATAMTWQETYLSAILRAILYADDPSYALQGFRKLDPITSSEAELKFLQTSEALFFKGTSRHTKVTVSYRDLLVHCRMAGWVRSGDSGCQRHVESFINGHFEVLCGRFPVRPGGQSIRKALCQRA